MYITKLCLRNYRNFKNSSFKFSKGVNTIIGENGCGKTNVMQAMRILLDETLPRNYQFSETDFNRNLLDWRGHWIIIQIFFDDLDHGDESQALALHLMGDAIDKTKGSCSAIFRPKYDVRRILYEYGESEDKTSEGLAAILSKITTIDYEISFTSRISVDFSDDEIYKEHVGDWEDIVFPNPAEQNNAVYGNKLYISNFTKEVSCTFIKALRDVEADLRSYRDNPLINLLKGKENNIEIKTKDDISKRILELNKEISDLPEVREVVEGVTNNIYSSVGGTYAPNISIRSELPTDMNKLMQSLKLWVGDSLDEPYLGRINELSLGGANLIYLSTKLLEYEKIKSLDKVANFLLVEEPEAHIHTHIQKTLFEKIPEGKTQVIISTHSTHISSVSKISSVNIISRFANQVEVYEPSNNLSPEQIYRIERYLDAVRSNLLFSKGVILVEGDAEQILIPVMFRNIFGISLDEIGISLINIGSTGFENIATLFHDDRIKKKCTILTDHDKSILPLPADSTKDTQAERDCRNSQIKGEERKVQLDDFIRGNKFIEAFYADNTFEVQFIESNNAFEVCELVTKQYKLKKTIDDIHDKLNNDDLSVSGGEILRLAEKYGKGWFALMLSEHITHLTSFPEYILSGFKFVGQHLSLNVMKHMATKRYGMLINKPFDGDKKDYKSLIEQLNRFDTKAEFIKHLRKIVPQDQLTKLLA